MAKMEIAPEDIRVGDTIKVTDTITVTQVDGKIFRYIGSDGEPEAFVLTPQSKVKLVDRPEFTLPLDADAIRIDLGGGLIHILECIKGEDGSTYWADLESLGLPMSYNEIHRLIEEAGGKYRKVFYTKDVDAGDQS